MSRQSSYGQNILTDRERQALDLLVRTGCNKLIAREMGVAPNTVEIHLASAREKMGAPNRVLQAVTWALGRPA